RSGNIHTCQRHEPYRPLDPVALGRGELEADRRRLHRSALDAALQAAPGPGLVFRSVGALRGAARGRLPHRHRGDAACIVARMDPGAVRAAGLLVPLLVGIALWFWKM